MELYFHSPNMTSWHGAQFKKKNGQLYLYLSHHYGLDDRVSIPGRTRDLFLFATTSRLTLGPSQPPIQWVPGAIYPGLKQVVKLITLSSSAEVKNVWGYTSTPPYIMVWCLVKHRDSFTFTFSNLSSLL
jgi:hypothetical protein